MSFILEALKKAEKEKKSIPENSIFRQEASFDKKKKYKVFALLGLLFLVTFSGILLFWVTFPTNVKKKEPDLKHEAFVRKIEEPKPEKLTPKTDAQEEKKILEIKKPKRKILKPRALAKKSTYTVLPPKKVDEESIKNTEEVSEKKGDVLFVEKLDLEKINILYNQATASFEKGDLETAKNLYYKILSEKPDHIESLNNLGLIYMREGKKEEAISTFGKILNIKSNYAKAYGNLGVIFLLDGKKKLAEEYLRKSIELGGEIDSYLNLANLLRSEKRYEEAENLLIPLIEKKRKEPNLVLLYALIKDEKGEHKEAIKYYRIYLSGAKTKEQKNRVLERLKYLEEIAEAR